MTHFTFHLEKAIAAAREAYRNDDEGLAALLLSGVYIYDRHEDSAAILAMAEEALAIRRRLNSADSALVTEALNYYAGALFMNGQGDRAEPLMRDALERPGLSDCERASGWKQFAEFLYELKQYDKALDCHTRGLALARPSCDSATLAGNLHSFAVLQRTIGNSEDAQQMAEEALAIRRDAYPRGECARHFVYSSMGLVGSIRALRGDFAAGAIYLEEAIENFDPPRWDKHMLAVRRQFGESLVRIYEDWESAEPGVGHAAKAAEWRLRER